MPSKIAVPLRKAGQPRRKLQATRLMQVFSGAQREKQPKPPTFLGLTGAGSLQTLPKMTSWAPRLHILSLSWSQDWQLLSLPCLTLRGETGQPQRVSGLWAKGLSFQS